VVRRAYPVRTCVGCRKRALASELLRVVAVDCGAGEFSIVADPARRRPGRGAHLHPDPACLVLAERRRAFGRALRVTGVLDTGPLAKVVSADASGTADGGSTEPHPDKQGRTTDMGTR
jgi:predicted RNA-binding protein YlxR (DUF448 family)